MKSTLLEFSIEVHTVEIPEKERKQAYKLSILLIFQSPNSLFSKSHGSQESHDFTSKISAIWLAYFFIV